MTDTVVAAESDRTVCWCCGSREQPASLVHLGNHPEVGVCLRCAHFLHRQARGREDAQPRTPAAGVRQELRKARQFVMRQQWHRHRLIGRPLRWLGQHLP